MIHITLPDGSQREYPGSVTVAEVAASIGTGLAKAALAGKIGDTVVDTSFQITQDSALSIVTAKDADGLDVIRHSTAHLLAYAVKELFSDAQVTIGPVIDNGFFYDFSYKRPFTPEDLAAIEKRMAELVAKDEPVSRRVLPRDEAVAYFKGLGEHYKAEIIASIPSNEDVSLYREGNFEDLCRGPHVPSTGKLKFFKLMKVAGAYWRGDHRNEMLQRIYGTAWATKDELQQYLTMLEEAEKRDHRKLGRELDLFHIDEHSPGTVFWHPNAQPAGRQRPGCQTGHWWMPPAWRGTARPAAPAASSGAAGVANPPAPHRAGPPAGRFVPWRCWATQRPKPRLNGSPGCGRPAAPGRCVAAPRPPGG